MRHRVLIPFVVSSALLSFAGCGGIKTSQDLFLKAAQIRQKALEEKAEQGVSSYNQPGPSGASWEEDPFPPQAEAVLARSPAVSWQLPTDETFSYKASYLGINVGTMTVSLRGKTFVRGREAYTCEVRAQTNGFFSKVFRVDDRFVSYVDAEFFYVLRQETYRREGKYKKDSVVDFDHEKLKAYYRHLFDGSEKVIDIPYGVQDIITATYYLRSLDWAVGDVIELKIYANEKVYDFYGLVKDRKKLKIPQLGIQDAFVFEPYAKYQGEMVRKGNAVGYFSPDAGKTVFRGDVNTPLFGKASILLIPAR